MNTGIRVVGYLLLMVGLVIGEFRSPAWSSSEPFPGFALFVSGQIGTHITIAGWLFILWARIRRLEAANAKG